MLTFISNLVGVKADKAMQAGVEALVRWDPQSASEAELRTMEQHLDDLGRQVAMARQSYDKELKEAEAIQALSHQRMVAAEQLEKQIAAETDPTRKAGLERSLATLVTMLEQMTPEIEREKKDAVDAKDFLEMLEKTYAEAGGKLRQGRSELDRARRDMARAGQQRQAAEQQAEAARRAAGLTSATSSMTVALKAMQEAANRDLASADAATAKARLLRPTQPEQDDPNIAAALAAASGTSPAPQSLSDRLAALRARGGG
jgi:chromosome segregation ATPase